MFTFAIAFCLIFQSAVAIYLLKSVRKNEVFDWQLRNFLWLLLAHIVTKFFLLFILQSNYPYGTIATGFSLFYAPYFFIITSEIVNQPVSKKAISLHLLPFAIGSVFFLLIVFFRSDQAIINDGIIAYNNVNLTVTMLSFIIYAVIIKRKLTAYQSPDNHFNQLLQIQLVNNVISIILMCGCVIGFLKLLHLIYPTLIDVDVRATIYLHLLLLPILVIRYKLKSTHRPSVPIRVNEENIQLVALAETAKRYQKSGLDKTALKLYEDKLMKHMNKNKPYLDADLSLEELAKQTCIPKHHLTQTLNDKVEKSFYQFVNEYRIEEAMRKLKNENEEVSMLSLAFDVGFNSKSSFNNYFKKVTGRTPSSYKKAILLIE